MRTTVITALLSGIAGGLITLFITNWRENARLRADLALRVIGWTDDVYRRALDMQEGKKSIYAGMKPYLSHDEYRENTRALRDLLIQNAILAQTQIVYGPGDEVALLRDLRDALEQATRILLQARKETWNESERAVKDLFEARVDPLRAKFEQRLLRHAGFPLAWLRVWRLPMRAALAAKERVANWWHASLC